MLFLLSSGLSMQIYYFLFSRKGHICFCTPRKRLYLPHVILFGILALSIQLWAHICSWTINSHVPSLIILPGAYVDIHLTQLKFPPNIILPPHPTDPTNPIENCSLLSKLPKQQVNQVNREVFR